MKINLAILIYIGVVLFMIGMGIFQFISKEPVSFYSGEKPFKKEELSDMSMWNKKHGTMWIIYGIVIILDSMIGTFIGADSLLCLIPLIGGLIVPLIFMIFYHNKLIKIYKK